MKRLFNALDADEIAQRVELLTERGILTRTQFVGGYRRPPEWVVYVCLDRQFGDAMALLGDPAHVVRDPVDVEQLDVQAREAGPFALRFLLLATGSLALVVLAILAHRVWS